MARKFGGEDLARLKRSVSIEALCRERGIELKKHGARDLIGKCPLHEEDTPSFVVTPEKNLFHCMGCDAGGSVIDLAMKLDGLGFQDAVRKLRASALGVEGGPAAGGRGPGPGNAKRPEPSEVAPEQAAVLLERTIAVYEKTFASESGGRAYLEKRGIADAALFSLHRAGYANGKLGELLPSGGTVRDELKAIGVLLENGHERFGGCVTFPVYGPDGRLVTIYGRFTRDGLKRHVYLPRRPTGLWNAAAVKAYPEIVLVESVIDALSAMMAGYRNVLSIQGSNGLGAADAEMLKRHGVRSVLLLLDGDEAGKRAARRLKEKLSSFSCRLLTLPDGEDPNSFLRKHGAQRLAQCIQEGQAMAAEGARGRAKGGTLCVPSGTSSATGTGSEGPVPQTMAGTPGADDRAGRGGGGDGPVVTYGMRREIREHTGWTNTRLHIHLRELVDMEYVIVESGRNGMPFRYRLSWEGQGKDGKRFMLGLTDPDNLAGGPTGRLAAPAAKAGAEPLR